jgi:hypothetical protein
VKILCVNRRPDLRVTFEYCETVIIPVLTAVARRRLVETGSTSACATVVCKWCKSAIALYCCM